MAMRRLQACGVASLSHRRNVLEKRSHRHVYVEIAGGVVKASRSTTHIVGLAESGEGPALAQISPRTRPVLCCICCAVANKALTAETPKSHLRGMLPSPAVSIR